MSKQKQAQQGNEKEAYFPDAKGIILPNPNTMNGRMESAKQKLLAAKQAKRDAEEALQRANHALDEANQQLGAAQRIFDAVLDDWMKQ